MSNAKSAAALVNFEAFANLSDASKELMRRGLRYVVFREQNSVLQRGQAVSGAYVVVTGRLRVFTISAEGKEATLYFIHPGETCVLALNCVFNDLLYPAWVEAEPMTKVAIVPGAIYRSLFEQEAGIRDLTVRSFSTLVFRLMAELGSVHSLSLEQRLIEFLVLHAASDGSVRMTQREIAAHLGSTREVIARLLRQLARAGYVETQRNQVMLKNPPLMGGWRERSGGGVKLRTSTMK